jgi:hypothetical protein
VLAFVYLDVSFISETFYTSPTAVSIVISICIVGHFESLYALSKMCACVGLHSRLCYRTASAQFVCKIWKFLTILYYHSDQFSGYYPSSEFLFEITFRKLDSGSVPVSSDKDELYRLGLQSRFFCRSERWQNSVPEMSFPIQIRTMDNVQKTHHSTSLMISHYWGLESRSSIWLLVLC